MPKYCASLSFLFRDVPLIDRFAAASAAGFGAVEILFPYDELAADMGLELARHDLALALINCPPPNYAGGTRGFAAIAGQQDRFRSDFKRAARYAGALGAQHLHVMSGVASGALARRTLVANLAWAAATAPRQKLTIEPINAKDLDGYYLNDFHLAADIIREVGAPNLHLQFDAYHAQRIHGDVLGLWDELGALASHVQVAGVPDRHEPGRGPVDWPAFFARLDESGYKGWVSAEYTPAGDTVEGLGWRV